MHSPNLQDLYWRTPIDLPRPLMPHPGHLRLWLKHVLTVQAGGDEDCAVCLSEMQQPCITLCAHVFCRPCIEKVIRWVSLMPRVSER